MGENVVPTCIYGVWRWSHATEIMRFPSTPITVGMITPHKISSPTHPRPRVSSSPPHLFNPSYFLTSPATSQTPYPPLLPTSTTQTLPPLLSSLFQCRLLRSSYFLFCELSLLLHSENDSVFGRVVVFHWTCGRE